LIECSIIKILVLHTAMVITLGFVTVHHVQQKSP